MLKANKSALFQQIFSFYNRNLLRRRFHSFQISGIEFLLNKNFTPPLIIYCNHSSWWDGLIAFEISRKVSLDSFIMMEEKQLRKYFFFRLLGAFSVVREKPREALKSIDYAANLLKIDPNHTLWLFPQGEILPNDLRPLKFFNGLGRIVEQVKECSTTSLSLRFECLGEFKPQIFVRVEKPQTISVDKNYDSKRFTKILSRRLEVNLEKLKSDIINGDLSDYQSIF